MGTGKRAYRDWSQPQICAMCSAPMYAQHRGRTAADQVRYGSRGMCTLCVQKLDRRIARPDQQPQRAIDWSVPQECPGCGRRLRPRHAVKDGRSVQHFARGLCKACATGGKLRPFQAALGREDAPPQGADARLDEFFAQRRQRKAAGARAARAGAPKRRAVA